MHIPQRDPREKNPDIQRRPRTPRRNVATANTIITIVDRRSTTLCRPRRANVSNSSTNAGSELRAKCPNRAKPSSPRDATRCFRRWMRLISRAPEALRRGPPFTRRRSAIMQAGEIAPGLAFVLKGTIDVRQGGASRHRTGHRPARARRFLGELAQLVRSPGAGRMPMPEGEVEALVVPPRPAARPAGRRGRPGRAHHARPDPAPRRPAGDRRRRAGDRRAAPTIGDVLRLENFLRRNGHPHQRLDPDSRRRGPGAAGALPRRAPGELPIVLCPGGQLLRNPSEGELARCIGLVEPIDPGPGLRRRHRRRRAGGPGGGGLCRLGRPVGAGAGLPRVRRPGRRLGADRELSGLSRPASPAWR